MTDKELDDLFQQSFSGHRMPVPEDMWQHVNPQKEKKRRVIFWWWTGLGIAALLLLAGSVAFLHTDSSLLKSSTTPRSLANSKSHPSSNTTNRSSKPASSNTTLIGKKASTFPVIKPSSTRKVGQNNADVVINEKKEHHQLSNARNISKEYSLQSKEQHTTDTPTSNETVAKTQSLEDNKSEEETASQNTLKATDSAASAKSDKLEKADSAAEAKPLTVQVQLPKHSKTSIEWMIAGYSGDRNVYNAEKEAPASFVSINNPQEKTAIRSYSFTVRIDKPINNHLSFKTGFQFLQTRQNITYNAESVSQSGVVNTLGLSSDTTRFTQISLRRPLIKSVYNSLSVPLLISYHTTGKKVSVGASGGIVLNVFSWYNGEVPDGSYRNNLSAKEAFQSNNGASLYLSLYFAKKLGNWQLFAEPQLQHNLSSITKSKTSFQQKMTYYGIGIGIKKSIGK